MAEKPKKKRKKSKLKGALEKAVREQGLPRELVSMANTAEKLTKKLKEEVRVHEERTKNAYRDGDGVLCVNFPYTPHPHQQKFHDSLARFRTIAAGVRGGKTFCGAFELVEKALDSFDTNNWCVAPTYKLLYVAEQELLKIFSILPEIVRDRSKAEHRYKLISGSVIECRSAEWPDQLRAAGLDNVWVTEGAYLKEEAIQILRTRVSDRLGRIWNESTPKGRNWFYRWFVRGQPGNEFIDHESFHWRSCDNPYFPEEEWLAAKRDLPDEVFRQEYLGEFLQDVAGVFRGVSNIVVPGTRRFRAVSPFYFGLDLGKHRDFTVLYGMDSRGRPIHMWRINKMSWPEQKREIAHRVRARVNYHLWMDSTGLGDPIYDELCEMLEPDRVHGVPFSTTSKRQMVQALQSAIEQEHIRIPEDRVLIDELKWFEYNLLPSGGVRYKAPKGFHDDCVFALALSNWGRLQGAQDFAPVMYDVDVNDIERDGGGHGIGFAGERSSIWRTSRLHGRFN